MWLRQSTPVVLKMGPFVDNLDGYTFLPSLVIAASDVRVSKNGGTMQPGGTGGTYDIDGMYTVAISALDTSDIGALRLSISKTGALLVWRDFMVVSAALYDTMFSSGIQDVNVVSVTTPASQQIADDLLRRDWTLVGAPAPRSMLNALRFLRNKWSVADGSLVVTREDDTTVAWSAVVLQTAGPPVTSVDPT